MNYQYTWGSPQILNLPGEAQVLADRWDLPPCLAVKMNLTRDLNCLQLHSLSLSWN